MFKDLKENLINLITSRLFILVIVFLAFGFVLVSRVFQLQIVNGEAYLNNFKLKIRKEKSIPSTRGKIYDRNGELLAYNELAYTVTIEDVYESGSKKNASLNHTILELIRIIEDNGDKIINDFNIILNEDNKYEFTVSDTQLLRFLADIYGHASIDDLSYAEKTATPTEVIEFLAGYKKYGVGAQTDPNDRKTFQVGLGYTKAELLKVVTIRYAMSANSFQKFIGTTVASDVSDETVAVVMENSDRLEGVSIAEDTIRKYVDSIYFSHIIGYTGKISKEDYDELSKVNENYSLNDVVGKSGIEKVMETDLQGNNGSETIYVDNLGKTIETSDRIEPTAGNDLYLTIDMNLQKAIYTILEQKIAGVLVSKIKNIKNYNPANETSASNIKIPIDDVYFAFFNNNILNTKHFQTTNAKETEREVYRAYVTREEEVFARLKDELNAKGTIYKDLNKEYQIYESYIVSMLGSHGVLMEDEIDTTDEVYLAWKKDETISLRDFLMHAIAKNWISVSKLKLPSTYSDSDEIFNYLEKYIFENLQNNSEFSKKIYRYMIYDNTVTGKQVCLLLWEQDILDISSEEIDKLRSGSVNAFNFMLERIENLDITPGQLALDPCSGSCVVTDSNTGEVLALVSYPSYDNNRLANNVDAEYFSQINTDLARPMWDYATQQRTAPGSTFKMVSTIAGLEEGVIDTNDTISCSGIFERITPSPRCWIHPGRHGALNASGAIANSCNVFFYEVGYRLSQDINGYNSDLGIQKLAYYADLLGLSETSGVEIMESVPKVSDELAVTTAIGQGTANYTTVGLARYVTTIANSGTCFNLSLIDKVTDVNGKMIKDYSPTVRNTLDLPQTTWDTIHTGMRGVVEKKAYYSNLGVNVAGKTGTAQENKNRPNHALFVGYAPYEDPEIAFATRIAFGYDSNYAAEITRDIMKYYFKLENEEELLSGVAERPDAVATGGD